MGEVDLYLDASFLVALLTAEPSSARADGFIRANPALLIVSDFTAAEFASAISRRVRMREMPVGEGQIALLGFDDWAPRASRRIEMSAADLALATIFLRRLDLPLRTPDGIHIAIAQRIGAALVTFDQRMAAAARTLGVPVAEA